MGPTEATDNPNRRVSFEYYASALEVVVPSGLYDKDITSKVECTWTVMKQVRPPQIPHVPKLKYIHSRQAGRVVA